MNTMLTADAYAVALGKSLRTVQRYLERDQLAGAQLVEGRWLIPADARPTTSYDVVATSAPATSHDVVGGRVFWTFDEVLGLFAPHVTRYALEQMLREGEVVGYKRGAHGAWLVPTGELRRLMGA